MDASVYGKNAIHLTTTHDLPAVIRPTYLAVLDFVMREQFRGACHATTGILHVLLQSQGVTGTLVTGELERDRLVFNHSWLEIDERIFDVSIALPLDEKMDGHPVFASCDLATLDKPYWNYGFSSGLADDNEVWVVKQRTFVEFMDSAPFHRHGLWHFVQRIGQRLNLKLSLNRLRAAHAKDKWVVR